VAITQQFYDAGHKYSFDNMAITPAQIDEFQRLLGVQISETSSLGNSQPSIGQLITVWIDFSGGFTAKAIFSLTSFTTAKISSVTYARTDTNELVFSALGDISFSTSNFSQVLQDSYLFSGADALNGNAYNNSLKGYASNDRIDGGAGIDTAYFSGFKSRYTISTSGSAMSVVGPDGTDTLLNIERLQFDDKAFAFDNGANMTYRLYQAAFDRKPDVSGVGYWISHIDKGMSLQDMAWNFINSPEFKNLYGATQSNSAFVSKLYENILNRPGDSGGINYWVGMLDRNEISRHYLVAEFSESAENQAQVVGSIQSGVEYTPFIA
jgi:hypothetical protein